MNDIRLFCIVRKLRIISMNFRSTSAKVEPAVQQYFSLDFDQIEAGSGKSSNVLPSLVTNDDVNDLLNEPVPSLPRITR